MTSSMRYYIWRLCVLALGALFISCGVYMFTNWIDIFTRMRGEKMTLGTESPSYEGWKVSPLPLNFDVYLFNWTNPEDFYVGSGKKPHFEELGPYRFRENPDKVDIVWHTKNSSVSYRKYAAFYFDEANSKGKLTDQITSVNTVAHGAALRAIDGSFIQKSILTNVLKMSKEGITITKTADEWMFTGYNDPLVKMGKFASIFSKDIVVPFDRVGWLYTRNDSSVYDGHFNIYTGADDIRKMGQIYEWNHQTHNGVYEGECGRVRGSMGEFFPANLAPTDSVEMYLQNLCRAIPLDYSETVKIHGVTAYKYAATERALDNGTHYPEMKCFCVNGVCEKSGVVNLGPCQYNSPTYTSYPHFYKADPSYLEAVEGLSPDPAKHEFFMTLEPNSGVPMDVGGGFQANYLLSPVPRLPPFHNIPRTFIPLMWAEERVRVTPEIASQIALVPLFITLGQVVTGIMFAIGVLLICWYPTKCISHACRDPKGKNALLKPITNSTARSVALAPLRKLQRDGVTLQGYKKDSEGARVGNVESESLIGPRLANVITR